MISDNAVVSDIDVDIDGGIYDDIEDDRSDDVDADDDDNDDDGLGLAMMMVAMVMLTSEVVAPGGKEGELCGSEGLGPGDTLKAAWDGDGIDGGIEAKVTWSPTVLVLTNVEQVGPGNPGFFSCSKQLASKLTSWLASSSTSSTCGKSPHWSMLQLSQRRGGLQNV